MSLTYRLDKGSELTYEEGDENFKYLDFKKTLQLVDPTATDNTFIEARWLNTITGKLYKCTNNTVDAVVWEGIPVAGELVVNSLGGLNLWNADLSKVGEVDQGSLNLFSGNTSKTVDDVFSSILIGENINLNYIYNSFISALDSETEDMMGLFSTSLYLQSSTANNLYSLTSSFMVQLSHLDKTAAASQALFFLSSLKMYNATLHTQEVSNSTVAIYRGGPCEAEYINNCDLRSHKSEWQFNSLYSSSIILNETTISNIYLDSKCCDIIADDSTFSQLDITYSKLLAYRSEITECSINFSSVILNASSDLSESNISGSSLIGAFTLASESSISRSSLIGAFTLASDSSIDRSIIHTMDLNMGISSDITKSIIMTDNNTFGEQAYIAKSIIMTSNNTFGELAYIENSIILATLYDTEAEGLAISDSIIMGTVWSDDYAYYGNTYESAIYSSFVSANDFTVKSELNMSLVIGADLETPEEGLNRSILIGQYNIPKQAWLVFADGTNGTNKHNVVEVRTNGRYALPTQTNTILEDEIVVLNELEFHTLKPLYLDNLYLGFDINNTLGFGTFDAPTATFNVANIIKNLTSQVPSDQTNITGALIVLDNGVPKYAVLDATNTWIYLDELTAHDKEILLATFKLLPNGEKNLLYSTVVTCEWSPFNHMEDPTVSFEVINYTDLTMPAVGEVLKAATHTYTSGTNTTTVLRWG